MNNPGFEYRCRRLLRWYPSEHRREHEDEMLAVMLATARPGQRRPSRREAFDIILGGIRVRLRRTFGPTSGPQWREAFARIVVLGTILLLADSAGWVIFAGIQLRNGWGFPIEGVACVASSVAGLAATMSLWAIVTGRRPAVTAATWILAAAILGWTGYWLLIRPETWSARDLTYYPPYLALVVTGALTRTADTRHAVESLGWRRILAFGAVAFGIAASTPLSLFPDRLPAVVMVVLSVAAPCVAAGVASRSPTGRRALALLAVPLIAFLTQRVENVVLSEGWRIGLGTLLVASIASTGGLRRTSRGTEPSAGQI